MWSCRRPAPLVRATLAWTANNEVDLHAFDPNGNHAGWVQTTPTVGHVVNNIPSAHHGGDAGSRRWDGDVHR